MDLWNGVRVPSWVTERAAIRRFAVFLPISLSVLAPILWYVSGRVPTLAAPLTVYALSLIAAVAGCYLGWRYRRMPAGWVASYGAALSSFWLVLELAFLWSAITGRFAAFVSAVEWWTERLGAFGNAIDALDVAVAAAATTAAGAAIAGLAVVVPLADRDLREAVAGRCDAVIDLLVSFLWGAFLLVVVHIVARAVPSPTYKGALAMMTLVLGPMAVSVPPLVGLMLRRAWADLRSVATAPRR